MLYQKICAMVNQFVSSIFDRNDIIHYVIYAYNLIIDYTKKELSLVIVIIRPYITRWPSMYEIRLSKT